LNESLPLESTIPARKDNPYELFRDDYPLMFPYDKFMAEAYIFILAKDGNSSN
jgi:hypothetical protein